MTDFVHLHVHSMASLLDGFSTADEIAARVKSIGQTSVAITDHGTMALLPSFSRACQNVGIKPLFGVEAYLTEDMKNKEKESKTYHIGLIARTESGLKKLFKISELAWSQGFYKKPRVDIKTLKRFVSDDIIMISGCQDGYVSRAIMDGTDEDARSAMMTLLSIGEHVFVEIQPWNPPLLNHKLINLADEYNVPIVVTADSHYASPSDKEAAEVALLLSQIPSIRGVAKERAKAMSSSLSPHLSVMDKINTLWPDRKLRFDKYQNHILSYEEIKSLMLSVDIDRDDIYENTVRVAEMCDDINPIDSTNKFPKFIKNIDSESFIREIAYDKLNELGLSDKQEYKERLDIELDIICRLGFADYMLVVWDMVHSSKMSGIMVGPGRGSVGGSLLAYVLGITEIDPIKFNLIFWRFLNVDVSNYNPKFSEVVTSR